MRATGSRSALATLRTDRTMRTSSLRTTAVRFALACSALIAAVPVADAQGAPTKRDAWELLLSSGALVPTGAQRGVIKNAPLSTAQLSYVARSRVAVTAMVGWARSRDLVTDGDPKLDVFTYDLGVEARAPRWLEGDVLTFTPFAGVGAGGRSYHHRRLDVDATHNLAGYGAVGGEVGMGRVHLRLEVRDYVTGFRPLVGGGASAERNDAVALVGLRFSRRQ
jgi:hypothetical protein